jgi:hypothetical protein
LSQPFSPRATQIARQILGIAAVMVGLGTFGLMNAARSGYVTRVGESTTQKIPFSHQHHVQGLGLDCRFCHHSVETSANAGFPDSQTCMTCHSHIWKNAAMLAPLRESFSDGTPLPWVQLTRLPDYVYFDHQIHVAKGVGCVTCHGKVSEMPAIHKVHAFLMHECIECHSAPGKFLRPPNEIFNENWSSSDESKEGASLVQSYGIHSQPLTDCTTCHH